MINQQNFWSDEKDKSKLEREIEELRTRLHAIEWDMVQGSFSKDKIPYYKKLLEEYEEMKERFERMEAEKQNG